MATMEEIKGVRDLRSKYYNEETENYEYPTKFTIGQGVYVNFLDASEGKIEGFLSGVRFDEMKVWYDVLIPVDQDPDSDTDDVRLTEIEKVDSVFIEPREEDEEE